LFLIVFLDFLFFIKPLFEVFRKYELPPPLASSNSSSLSGILFFDCGSGVDLKKELYNCLLDIGACVGVGLGMGVCACTGAGAGYFILISEM
jgi:hypothetical protein